MIWAWEFPDEYWAAGNNRSNTLNADSHWIVYQNRLKEMWPYVKAVAELRAKCGAVVGDDAAAAAEKLANTARQLQFYMQQHTDQLRAGPEGVTLWADQDFVQEVKNSVTVSDAKDDKFSKEFDAAFDALLNLLKRHA
jgi:hypothetical protein